MKELFTDFYKKVAGFFQGHEEKENVKDVACNRLKFVLMQDRTNLNPQLLERMRGELIDLLSKYVEMDKEALELNFAQEGESMALMLSIPVVRAKDEEEINALIKAEEADCEQRAKRLAEEQGVADPLSASNQEEAKAEAEAEKTEEDSEEDDSEENPDEVEAEAEESTETCSCGCEENDSENECDGDCDCSGNCGCGCGEEQEESESQDDCDCKTEEKPATSKKSKKK